MRLSEYDDDDLDLLLRKSKTVFRGTPKETKQYWQDLADLREPIEREYDDYPGLNGYRGRHLPADQDNFEDEWN
jgi:hypothetical protein